jgi:TRAP-type C4-dicarboxylate transport system substrate-binding protein
VAEAMDLTKSAYAGFKLYEVVPYLTETAHIWASGVVYFSKGFWDSLPAEQQTVLAEAVVEGAFYFNDLIVADEETSVASAKAAGGQVLQPEAREEWVAKAKGVWESFAPVVGGQERIDSVLAIG